MTLAGLYAHLMAKAADPSHAGELTRKVVVHRDGRRVTHWVKAVCAHVKNLPEQQALTPKALQMQSDWAVRHATFPDYVAGGPVQWRPSLEAFSPYDTAGASAHFDPHTHELLKVTPGRGAATPEAREALQLLAKRHGAEQPIREEVARAIKALPVVYFRLGRVPASGRSYNYREGHDEPGVSVYRAYRDGATLYLDCTDGTDPMVFMGPAAQERPWYLVDGDEMDAKGSDGEPVLNNVRGSTRLTRKPRVCALFPEDAPHDLFWNWLNR